MTSDNTDNHASRVSSDRPQWGHWALLGLTATVFASVVVAEWPWHVYDRAPVRQTQTLLTVLSFLEQGFAFDYETPIFAHPWKLPLEFPLYQASAAMLSRVLGVSPASAAQGIGLACFVAALLVGAGLLRRWGMPKQAVIVTVSLTLATPLYLFWSQTVSIESTALLLALAYLRCMDNFFRTWRWRWLAAAALLGAVAGAVKATTFVGWLALGVCVFTVFLVRNRASLMQHRWRILGGLALGLGLPLVATAGWTSFADSVKAAGGPAAEWTSQNLRLHLYGSFEQRLSPATWRAVLVGRTLQLIGSPLGPALVALALLRASRWRLHVALCSVGFLLPYLVFTNLHFLHDYYSYANGILFAYE